MTPTVPQIGLHIPLASPQLTCALRMQPQVGKCLPPKQAVALRKTDQLDVASQGVARLALPCRESLHSHMSRSLHVQRRRFWVDSGSAPSRPKGVYGVDLIYGFSIAWTALGQ